MIGWQFIEVAEDLDTAGLVWCPEIGDEVSSRQTPDSVSILVDPDGMTPGELRQTYLWLPTIEQIVLQIEARQGILFHAGLELTEEDLMYKTVVQAPSGQIESRALSMRASMGKALRDFLIQLSSNQIH